MLGKNEIVHVKIIVHMLHKIVHMDRCVRDAY
jgi:hypothetical protein